jgi:hypothetical protein
MIVLLNSSIVVPKLEILDVMTVLHTYARKLFSIILFKREKKEIPRTNSFEDSIDSHLK